MCTIEKRCGSIIFYCIYKLVEDCVVEETVDALSSREAKRKILLKHPLAEFIGEPTTEKPAARFENSKKVVATKISRRILLIAMSCITFLAGLLFLSMYVFHDSSIRKDGNKTIITNDATYVLKDSTRHFTSRY